jgi:hypothetical protein
MPKTAKPAKRSSGRRRQNNRPAPDASFFEKEFRVQKWNPLDKQIVRTVKTFQLTNVVTSTTVNTFRSYAFSVSSISDITEMSSVFDQYRISWVEVKFIPNITEAISSTPLSGLNYTAIDLDDANAFTSFTDALDYNSLGVWKPLETIQVSFKPRMAVAAYGASVFGSFANTEPMWIDAASSTVEHYGLKTVFGTSTSSVTYVPICRLHVEWRMQH